MVLPQPSSDPFIGFRIECTWSTTPDQVDTFLSDLRSAFTSLSDFRMPTIAAIDGPALGGGLELALSVDLRVAGKDVSKIGLPETKLGIIPGAGGTQRAARLLGPSKAKDLIFTGRMLDAEEALAFGMRLRWIRPIS